MKPNGFLLREASAEEADYVSKNSLEVDVHFPPAHPTSMVYETQSGHTFETDLQIEDHQYVLLHTGENGTALVRVLPTEYVEECPGSASTLEVDGHHIEIVKR